MRRIISSPLWVLGLCFILGAAVFGLFFYQSRFPEKTVRVVGAATMRLESDIVKWRVSIIRNTGIHDLKNGYNQIKKDLEEVKSLLREAGIPEKSLVIQPVNTNPVYGQYERGGVPTGYMVQQSFYLVSERIDDIERFALNPAQLSDKGIVLQSSNLEYYYSKLSEIKRKLLAEATTDARKRAMEIAKSSGDKVGSIQSARVGVFQITEPYSTEVADYGIYNTFTREKDITVTVNVVFELK